MDISQSVVASDMVEFMNLGMAAGYWNMDTDSKAALLLGLREYEDMTDGEFAQSLGGMVFSEGERFFGKTLLFFDHASGINISFAKGAE